MIIHGIKLFRIILSATVLYLLCHTTDISAQTGHTLYFMKGVPQSNTLNPALQPACNIYIGIPGLSSLQQNFQNDPLVGHDVFFYDPVLDSAITFLHPAADPDHFLSLLNDMNFIQADVSASIISFGFKAKNLYFSFGLSTKSIARIDYPNDLARIPLYGTLDSLNNPININLSGTSVQTTIYNEYSAGVSRKFGQALTVGVRGKLLFGLANINTGQMDVTINTAFDEWLINSRADINASLPYVNIPTDADGNILFDSITFENPTANQMFRTSLNNSNFGLAIDAGAEYRPYSWLTVSASVIDLGYIHWRNDVHNLSLDTSFLFNGIDLSSRIRGDDTTDIGQALLDSLEGAFTYTSSANPYSSYIPTKIYIGGTFNLNEKYSFGLLSISEICNHHWRQSLSVSANLMPIRGFSTSLSYSIFHNRYHTLGLGLSFKLGPVHTYFILDYVPTTFDRYHRASQNLLIPAYNSSFSLRFGLNVLIGGDSGRKLLKDIPLIE
jgi:hypothetical protein